MSGKVKFDKDNPEWTKEDFAKAQAPEKLLSPDILSAFPKTRGTQKASKKIPISIRLSADVVAHYKSTGPGWQGRIDEALKKVAGL